MERVSEKDKNLHSETIQCIIFVDTKEVDYANQS